MAYRLPPLNSLKAFEAAARLMSFQKAAEELFVTPSALSYQIRQLEEHLQIPLFERLNRAVMLTEAGERLYPGIHEGLERFQGAVRSVGRTVQNNVLVVSSGPAFAAKWLAPRVYKFVDEFPEIELRIAANLRLSDFNVDEVDCALRFGGGDYPDLYSEPLFTEAMVPLVSPKVLERFDGELGEKSLSELTLLHDDSSNFIKGASGWHNWLERMGYKNVNPEKGPRFNHADHGLDAAVDGAGIVLGRLSIAMRDIKSGRLVAPFKEYIGTQSGFHFVAPESALELPRVASFRQWLLKEAEEEATDIAAFLANMRSL